MSTRLVIGLAPGVIAPGASAGQLDFGFGTLRTMEFSVEPQMDPTGKDFLCSKITLEVSGMINRCTIATNKAVKGGIGPDSAGDDMAFTIANVRDWLMLPRQYFRLDVGTQTIVESPAKIVADGSTLSCDVRGGPFPQRANFTPFIGAKSAMLHYRVTTYQSCGSTALLSNRWSMSSEMGRDGLTTRTTRGRAIFAKDYLDRVGAQADDFRKWLVVPVGDGMRRADISVEQNEDGSEITYTVVDEEVIFCLGGASAVLEVTGTATGSIHHPIRDIKSAASVIAGVPSDAGKVASGGWLDKASSIVGFVNKVLPTARYMALARAVGVKGASRIALEKCAIAFCIDRLRPVMSPESGKGKGSIVSLTCTHNLDTDHAPFVEVRVEVFGAILSLLNAIASNNPSTNINVNPVIKVKRDHVTFEIGPTGQGPQPPNSSGTRGTWTGRLVAQALASIGDAYDIPDDPPLNQVFDDTTGPF